MKLCSVIIVNWNGVNCLKKCLEAVFAQAYEHFEVIVIDNASSDDSLNLVKDNFPDARAIKNSENVGFSAALNQGITSSRGDYVLSPNADVVLDKDFIGEMIGAMEGEKGVGWAAGKLLYSRTDRFVLVYSVGHEAFINRTFASRGQMDIDVGQFDKKEYVFGSCAAAAMYKRDMLEDIKIDGEYFDSSYFAYCEDVDVDWRAQIRGWKCLYVPTAVAIHESKSLGNKKALSLRNRIATIIKNEYPINYFIDLPFIFVFELSEFLYRYMGDRKLWAALGEVISGLPALLRKRRLIQSRRVASASDIRRHFKLDRYNRNLFISFWVSISFILAYIYFFGALKALLVILAAYALVGGGASLMSMLYGIGRTSGEK